MKFSAPFLLVALCLASPTHAFSLSTLFSPLTDATKRVTLGPAKIPEDLDAIRECRKSAQFDRVGSASSLLDSELSFLNADAARSRNVVCFLARESIPPFRVVGSADIKTRRKTGEVIICNVFVKPELRSKGLGRKIMQGAEAFVASRGDAKEICLDVYVQNTAAIKLYRQLGYKTPSMHSVTSFLGSSTGLNLQVRMTKELNVTPSTLAGGAKLAF
jgi:ribosomal protein S18 acetylase RimI-like enzyme